MFEISDNVVAYGALSLIPVVIVGAFFAMRWAKRMDEKRNRII